MCVGSGIVVKIQTVYSHILVADFQHYSTLLGIKLLLTSFIIELNKILH